jgi:hypothetical protein
MMKNGLMNIKSIKENTQGDSKEELRMGTEDPSREKEL